jgi:hypothetical protein
LNAECKVAFDKCQRTGRKLTSDSGPCLDGIGLHYCSALS